MRIIDITPDRIVESLVNLAAERRLAILDSCGVGRKGENLLIAGIDPVEIIEMSGDDPAETLRRFDDALSRTDLAAIFTLSYDFGLALQNVKTQSSRAGTDEPGLYLALFNRLLIHDYSRSQTFLAGTPAKFDELESVLRAPIPVKTAGSKSGPARSNFTHAEYLEAIEQIKEFIRAGDTYQVNLTQKLTVPLADGTTSGEIFCRLRREHPAPFAAYIDRSSSQVVSASPENFLRVTEDENGVRGITASPIKGTRPCGRSPEEDEALRQELLTSEKDRAENTMIVDLMRNDLGRICDFGTVAVTALCRLEQHPTLFHLVSDVAGTLSTNVSYSDVIKAVFPCGSITGAPKIRTMYIIEEIENERRGLSMGAIGCRIPQDVFGIRPILEMSVAIRTMVIRDGTAVFNVGGGIVIDSDPESEYKESLLKAKALLHALKAAQ